MKEFKIGDRVKCLRPTDNKEEIVGECGTIIDNTDMDEWDRVGVEFDENINGHRGNCNKGKPGHCWNCIIDTLEKITETKLENITLQKGDIVTYKLGGGFVVNEYGDFNLEEIDRLRDIGKIERPIGYATIYKAPKKDILEKEEKEYLSAVIRPFKNKITSIVKIYFDDIGEEYIKIKLGECNDSCSLPFFKKGTMYKGMEPDKEYTLEELGL